MASVDMSNMLQGIAKLLPLEQSSLFIYCDGFNWLGVIQKAGTTQVQAWATSREPDYAAALSELKATLRSQVAKLPKQVHLLNAGVVNALLDLPLEGKEPRPEAQMQELVRWELEQYVADYNDLWSIGAVLQAQGALSSSQRHEVAVELELRRNSGAGRSLSRFGELALELNMLARADLEQALAVQEKLLLVDENLHSNWHLQASQDADGVERYAWLCSAISHTRRKQWLALFAQHGFVLQSFSAMQANSQALVHHQVDSEPCLVVEQHLENLVVYQLQQGVLVSLQSITVNDSEQYAQILSGVLSEQLRADIKTIYLQLYCANKQQVSEQIEQQTGRKVQFVNGLAEPLTPQSHMLESDIDGAYLAYMQQQLEALSLSVQGRQQTRSLKAKLPAPPWYKNLNLWRYMAPFIVAAVALVVLVEQQLALRKAEAGFVEVEAAYDQQVKLNRQLAKLNGETNQVDKQLAGARQLLLELNSKINLIENDIIGRAQLLPHTLRALASSVDDEVLIQSVFEPKYGEEQGFKVAAWASTSTAAQSFLARLSVAAKAFDYRVSNDDVRSNIGRYRDLNGYSIELWLVPDAASELDEIDDEDAP